MANQGKLCYVKGGSLLAYQKNGTALIYKGLGPAIVTVRVPWSPQSYTCNTYSAYHTISFTCSGSFTQGAGTIVSQETEGTETVFKLKVTAGPATFRVLTSCTTGCSALDESPDMECRVLASQRDAAPLAKANVSVPRTDAGSSPAATDITFDANRKLTGIN